MSGHTNGPWAYNIGSGVVKTTSVVPTDVVARYVDTRNGSLIAAAPDLLAALKAMLATADHTLPVEWRSERPVSAAKAAIAKAEGR